MKSAESNLDRRAFGRRPTTINANVRLGYRIVACVIKDISEGGALLEFDEEVDLPSRLWLSWADSAEIMCDVRHQRNRRAGVQFLRPQALALRPAVVPIIEPAAQPAPRAKAAAPATRAFDIVARCRRAMRTPAAAPATVSAPSLDATPLEQVSVTPPRDVSTILASLRAAAQALVLEREARKASAKPGQDNRPEVASLPPAPEISVFVPLPMPARGYAQDAAPAAVIVCKPHPCNIAVWRSITSPPPRPLPARRYAAQVA